jgi:hypothetical protein
MQMKQFVVQAISGNEHSLVINKKEITAQHWFGHMAFLAFGQSLLENVKTLKVLTQIWGQSRNLLFLCGRLWL